MKRYKLKRVLIKLTGELLCGPSEKGIDFKEVDKMARGILSIKKRVHCDMAIVIGGGNLFRGRDVSKNVDKATADYIGTLGTIMNGLALEEGLNRLGGKKTAVLMTALQIFAVSEPFFRKKALKYLDDKKIVILAGGTGNPFFSTDSAAALRAAELNCDVILKGSTVDGVYTKDPKKYKDAKKYKYLNYKTALVNGYEAMDNNSFAICQRERIPILLFKADDLNRILDGEKVGTMISEKKDEFFG